MNTQLENPNYIVLNECETALGELKAIILKNMEKERMAEQPNLNVDHLTEESTLEPVINVVPTEPVVNVVPTEPVVNIAPTEPVIDNQPVVSPVDVGITSPGVQSDSIQPVNPSLEQTPETVQNIPLPTVQSEIPSVEYVSQNIEVPSVNSVEMQTPVIDNTQNIVANETIPNIVNNEQSVPSIQTEIPAAVPETLNTPTESVVDNKVENVQTQNVDQTGIETVPEISVADYSVPTIETNVEPTIPVQNNVVENPTPAVPNISTVVIDPIPSTLDTGTVELPNGSNTEISNDPTMVVGPETFSKSM